VLNRSLSRKKLREMYGQHKFGEFSTADHYSQQIQEAAQNGEVDAAERAMYKVCNTALEPDIVAFNALLEALAKQNEMEKAEIWMMNMTTPAFHPKFSDFQGDAKTYNIMVEAYGRQGNMPGAEKWANDARAKGYKLVLPSYMALIRACLNKGETRRAHRWAMEMIASGVRKPNKEVMNNLVHALADVGNTQSANYWLGYMADSRIRLDDATYSYVRNVHPDEIVPGCLSGEHPAPLPPEARPATLLGEQGMATEARRSFYNPCSPRARKEFARETVRVHRMVRSTSREIVLAS